MVKNNNNFQISTKCIHQDNFVDKKQNMSMVMNPIYQGSTIIYSNYEEFKKNCRKDIKTVDDIYPFPEYGRIGNPTIFELSKTISSLENGDFSIITNGGMSAVTLSILSYLEKGDHILLSDGTYTSTKKFIENILPKYGIEYSYYDNFESEDEIKSKIKVNTRVIFFESCASGTFEVENIELIVNIAKKLNIITICDNTLMTPILLNPITLGVDVVVHSLSKFILGHADCMLGSVTVKEKNFNKLYDYATLIGNHANSQACYLALRGIKTLTLRVKDSKERIKPIIEFLKTKIQIKEILHPYVFADHIRKKNVDKYCQNGVPSLLTIVLNKKYSDEVLSNFFDSMQIFKLGLSWGGFESLAIPYPLSHRIGKISEYDKYTCIRMYIGMEDFKDIKTDLENAFLNLV